MEKVPMNTFISRVTSGLTLINGRPAGIRSSVYRRLAYPALLLLVLLSSFVVSGLESNASATGQACNWYRVVAGDTLGQLTSRFHQNIWQVAQTNHISNVNLIFTGQNLCMSTASGSHQLTAPSGRGRGVRSTGLQANGAVRWYAYNALEGSTQSQVRALLRQTAARYGLPANLLLAIAWQESGWNQHVIARDGGIGTMQLMPYTAMGLNQQTRMHYDPYKLWDNIALGAIYLRSLWRGFGGNLTRVISAYNEGGWNVLHRGIFNWGYVNNVRALMRRY